MDSAFAIDVSGLSKSFGPAKVVDDFAIQVPRGSIYGFLGPNGSGKTTTIRMLCGLLKPDHGSGTCLGYDIFHQADRIKKHIGYMTQKFSLYEDLSVVENLEFIARMYGVPDRKAKVDAIIEEMDLTPYRTRLAGKLSGGWKQRLALSACAIHEPQLLFLDEPTAGVDPEARRDFWERIRGLSDQGVTVLVTTHYMDEAVQCDSIAYIAYGRKLIDAPSADLPKLSGLVTWRVEGPNLKALYDALVGKPGVDQVVRFGTALHVSGRNEALLDQSVAAYRNKDALVWTKQAASLEEVFIQLMRNAKGDT